MSGELLELPSGHELFSFRPGQVAAARAVYLASMRGGLEELFGPVQGLRGREFLVEVDGEHWIATPTPGLYVASDEGCVMVFDTGGIHAKTDGQHTTIDLELVRPAGQAG